MAECRANDIRRWYFPEYAESTLPLYGTADDGAPFDGVRSFAENRLIEFIPVQNADHRFRNSTHMSLANKCVTEFVGF